MSIITKGYRFDPVDILVFRDGMPFNQNDHGQVRMHSIFPPNQETIAGALRAAYARQQGWQGGNWAKPYSIKTAPGKNNDELSKQLLYILGNGQNIDKAAITYGAVYLTVFIEDTWQRLYPVPHDFGVNENNYTLVKESGGKLEKINIDHLNFSELHNVKYDIVSKKHAHSASEIYLTPLYNHWATEETLMNIFGGKGIDPKEIYYGAKSVRESWLNKKFTPLWSEESRTGIQRCHERHTAVEGMLYQINGIRLEENVAIAIDVNLDKGNAGDWEPCSCIPLGAEGHFATINKEDSSCGFPPDEYFKTTANEYCITLISPAIINPEKLCPGMDWSDEGLGIFMGAAMNRALTRGGWSSITGSQQNATVIPAGATLYFETGNKDFSDESILAIGEKQKWGYGRYILRYL